MQTKIFMISQKKLNEQTWKQGKKVNRSISRKFYSSGLVSLWKRQQAKGGSSSYCSVLYSFIQQQPNIFILFEPKNNNQAFIANTIFSVFDNSLLHNLISLDHSRLYNRSFLESLRMGWSTNQKAQAKRDRQDAKKKEKVEQKKQAEENRKWKDSQTDKKLQQQRQREQKREKQIARKRQLKELAEQQERQLEKTAKKKETFAEKKLTQAEIALRVEQRQKQAAKEKNQHMAAFFEDNPNRALEDYEVTGTVQHALRVLDVGQEKHPEKRFKAAFQAYCAKREVALRVQYPKLKRSQRLQMMRKEFQKHPDNPFNKNVVAYNDKTRKEARKAKQQEQEGQKQENEENEEKVQTEKQENNN